MLRIVGQSRQLEASHHAGHVLEGQESIRGQLATGAKPRLSEFSDGHLVHGRINSITPTIAAVFDANPSKLNAADVSH